MNHLGACSEVSEGESVFICVASRGELYPKEILKMFHVEHFNQTDKNPIKMIEKELIEVLKRGALELEAPLPDSSIELFLKYLQELKAWNKKINLTSIKNDRDIVIKHFFDSLTPYRFIKGAKRLMDIGSGGGFPGIPLKILDPALNVTLLDAVEKKVHFLRHIIRALDLLSQGGIEAVWGRAEERGMIERYGSSFDCVISRAFSELKDYLKISLPYAAPNGIIIAMKGPAFQKELTEAAGFKGVEKPEVFEVKLPFSDRVTTIIRFKKAAL